MPQGPLILEGEDIPVDLNEENIEEVSHSASHAVSPSVDDIEEIIPDFIKHTLDKKKLVQCPTDITADV